MRLMCLYNFVFRALLFTMTQSSHWNLQKLLALADVLDNQD